MGFRVLVVEDDPTIGDALRDGLRTLGYTVDWVVDGAGASWSFRQYRPDLVLLDAGLPDVDGFELCRSFRVARRDVRIVMITARDADIDIVVGLDAGADDYVVKPFSLTVVLARVRAHLRAAADAEHASPLALGSLRVDPAARLVWVRGELVSLRQREFDLLHLLVKEAGRVVTRERLLAEVWGLTWETTTRTVEMHVHTLRAKLGDGIDLATVRGIGYRLDLPSVD